MIHDDTVDVMAHEISGPSNATIKFTAKNNFVVGAQAMAGGLLSQHWLYHDDRSLEHVPKMPTPTPVRPYIFVPYA